MKVKKKIVSMIILASMTLCLTFTSLMSVHAANESTKIVDGSNLTLNEYSEGSTKSGITTRGVHLMDGTCSITKSGVGKVYAYGSTTAGHDVDFLSVVVYVEKYNATDDTWERIYAWQEKKINDYYISTAKTISVDRGYYYRVRAEHVCGNNDAPYDEEFSFTDGILIP